MEGIRIVNADDSDYARPHGSPPGSPSLAARANAQWLGQPHIKGSNEFQQMILLTICVCGLQFTWGVEMSYINIYLLSLGMSKSMLSVVWAAGPISGLLMQPIVGAMSDNSTSKYGRRRPFMIVGTAFVSLGLIVTAWARDIVGIFGMADLGARTLATLAIFLTDFSINSVQACCRAIIVDTLPPEKQELGNGWAGRMIGTGHLIGYFMGYLNLVEIFHGLLGDSQLKNLCVISSLALVVTVSITSYAVTERIQLDNGLSGINNNGYRDKSLVLTVWEIVRGIYVKLRAAVKHLPQRIMLIFVIQFCAWYGWFTFLFYSATWVSEVYLKSSGFTDPNDGDSDLVGKTGRVASMSLMVFSFVSLIFSWILPMLIEKDQPPLRMPSRPATPSQATSNFDLMIYFFLRRAYYILSILATPLRVVFYKTRKLVLQNNWGIEDLWLLSHFVYAIAVFSTGFVSSLFQATVIVGLCGFAWAVVTWAPFSLLAQEVHALTHANPIISDPSSRELYSRDEEEQAYSSQSSFDASDESTRLNLAPPTNSSTTSLLLSGSPRRSSLSERDFHLHDSVSTTGEQSGVYLGIHNVAITVPQLVSTLVSGIIFSVVSPHHEDGPDIEDGGKATALTLQIGSITACIAAYFTYKLKNTPRQGATRGN